MMLDDFRQSLTATQPPTGLTLALAGLWWDAKGDWTRAHESAQQDEGRDGSWVHAYLHRKEGDQDNGAYWYRRAGKTIYKQKGLIFLFHVKVEKWKRLESICLIASEVISYTGLHFSTYLSELLET